MSNAINCSTMFNLPNPNEVEIVSVEGGFEVRWGSQLIWQSSDYAVCERMMQSFIENGV